MWGWEDQEEQQEHTKIQRVHQTNFFYKNQNENPEQVKSPSLDHFLMRTVGNCDGHKPDVHRLRNNAGAIFTIPTIPTLPS